MRTTSLCGGLACAALAGLLFGFAPPAHTTASQPGFAASQAAAPAFLLPSGPAPASWLGGASAPPPGPSLPSSVMPHMTAQCSVETLGDADVTCSVLSSVGFACSAHCDSGQSCSAFEEFAGTGTATCSTQLAPRTNCSVLPPAFVPPQQGGRCSATGGDRVGCSILAPHGNQGKQACSAANPGGPDNFCSAIHSAFTGPGNPHCSVLGSGTSRPSYCSTGFVGQKTCSALGEPNPNGGPASCSVAAGNFGVCTSLKGAPAGSCSVISPPGDCSVIGGPSGGPICRQP